MFPARIERGFPNRRGPLLQAFSTLVGGSPAMPTYARIRWPVTMPWRRGRVHGLDRSGIDPGIGDRLEQRLGTGSAACDPGACRTWSFVPITQTLVIAGPPALTGRNR